jgi:hypothetical protein
MADAMITAAAEAIEEAMVPRIGRDLGTIHRDPIVAACVAAGLRVMADEIDRGPTFDLPPSVISALVRERADGLIGGTDG